LLSKNNARYHATSSSAPSKKIKVVKIGQNKSKPVKIVVPFPRLKRGKIVVVGINGTIDLSRLGSGERNLGEARGP
jgi:hypothetical protein